MGGARGGWGWSGPRTLQDRDLDFAHAESVFAGPTFTFEDDRADCGEQRWVTLGLLRGKVLDFVHTETEAEIRVISITGASEQLPTASPRKNG